MKTPTPLITIALSILLSGTLGLTTAEAAAEKEKEKQKFGKLIPLSATFDDSNTLHGHLEVRGARVALRSRTARRSGHLASAVYHSRRRWSGRANLTVKPRANSLATMTATSAESGFKLAAASSSPQRKLASALKASLALLPAQLLKTHVSSAHAQTNAAKEDADCTCHEARRFIEQKRYADAAIAYEKYADKLLKTFNKENGDYANALAWQGYSLEMQGRKQEARKILEKAAQVYRQNKPGDETLSWINERLAQL